MSVVIAPTAVIDPKAQLGTNVRIGHFSVIGPDVSIGDGTVVDQHAVITAQTTIGENNRIFAGTVIGGDPQDTSYKNSPTKILIGDNNIFREHCTVNRATEKEDGITEIGHDNYFMAGTHVAHDCKLGDRIVIANNGMLGGHVRVGNDVTIAGGVGVSHFASIGQLSFVSAMSRVLHDVPPYTIVDGQPSKPRAVNTIGLKRHGYTSEDVEVLVQAFRLLYRARVGIEKARDEVYSRGPIRPVIKHLFDSIERSCSGRHGRGQDQRGKKKAA
ncbi:acyl-ACP--UDP-N-acetylglucosamine O-acyltransferase [Roseiconus lacunae]|uniref:Acyl-ACP--UDP-N-acetylglucosamine O-acyltransferase n=1 Tax=Roseiconus lacunae TaxID=2605694 RepID=A0ABT7PM54_9BACT|nr:acyl-ACP--UDP-N-acetylglucosamine O-acyltransferase [Roseiconus lacunae]MCD0461518.1 acyl-ACP--UDP-N-acetylglucosamine O-acyltransferase [Roseiconus lacunae]MDM4017595.1 acyl-ACP--UDP-N-acetylglucosamine O-acyltransferase [Roseiconus lacunae]WRQ51141.1 acyl-ACP--UDP-N-acetylglucosamine O-acyltransferase [Stieleria sp. HD01]